jgi:hypothetical protein
LGVPQGGIISPLLSNLVLHKLDEYLDKLIREREKRNKGLKPYMANPKYHKLTMQLHRLKAKKVKGNWDAKMDQKKMKDIIFKRRCLKSIIPNPHYVRFRYVRYADDWLVGIWGTKVEAGKLKKDIRIFLEGLKLELSMEKTLITNARSERAKFLGIYIKRIASNKGPTKCYTVKKERRRIPTGNVWMTAPILEMIKRLEDKKFLKTVGER